VADSQVTFELALTVASDLAEGTTLVNDATVSSATLDPTPSNNDDEAAVGVLVRADVGLIKLVEPADVVAGEAITYTIVLTNYGPSTARDVDVKDFLPEGVTLQTATIDGGVACLTAALCQLGDVAAGDVVTMTLVGDVDPSLLAGTLLTNTAHLFSDSLDPNPDNDEDDAISTVAALAQLTIEKRDWIDPVGAGGDVVYQIAVTNSGPSDAQDVIVVDVLPSELTFLNSTADCVEAPSGTLTCTLGTVAAGETATFNVTGRSNNGVPDNTVITNRVTLTSSTPLTPDSVVADEEDTTLIQTDGGPADLAIVKSADPTTLVHGEQVVFTLIVTNNGPAVATNVEVLDALPNGLTLISAETPSGTCSGGICQIAQLAVAESATITVTAQVDLSVADGATLTNNAAVYADQPDPVADNNSDEADVTVNGVADLAISKSADANANAGEQLVYTLVITNRGPSNAENVVVTDTLPAGVTVVSAAGCAGSGSELVCTLGDMAVGQVVVKTIVLQIADDFSGTLTNRVTVGSDTDDPISDDDGDQTETAVTLSADVAITKRALSETVIAGDVVTFVLDVVNNGPSVATSVSVTDLLPTALEYVDATPLPSGLAPLVWTLGDLAVGEMRQITLTVRALSTTPNGQLLRNTAVVTSTADDPVLGNNSDQDAVQAFGLADLGIIKTALTNTVLAGDTITYAVTVTNYGPSTARSVVASDLLPDEMQVVSSSPSQGSCNGTSCNLGDIPAGGVVTITFVALAESDLPAGSQLTNIAVVSSDTPDPNAANDTDAETVGSDVAADMLIEKRLAHDVVPGGGQSAYILRVTNLGPSDATNVAVSDTLPDQATFVLALPVSETEPPDLTWLLGDMLAGEVREITIFFTVDGSVSADFDNTATVISDTPDPDLGNNEDAVTTTLDPSADINVTKSVTDDIIRTGDLVTFTITVNNAGPSDAQQVVVTDTLPVGLEYVRATPTPTTLAPLTWDLGTIAVDESAEILLTVRVTSQLTETLTNTVAVDSVTPDPVADDNEDVAPVAVAPPLEPADVFVVKWSAADEVTANIGDVITWTLRVGNNGPGTAYNVIVTDVLPDNVYFDFAIAPPTTLNPLTWSLGDLAAGEVETIVIYAYVGDVVGDTMTNTVTVVSDSPDPVPGNNGDDDVVDVIHLPPTDVVLTGFAGATISGLWQVTTSLLTAVGAGSVLGYRRVRRRRR
jgi:uncharacterized repeat protein (TIGR01451 family)